MSEFFLQVILLLLAANGAPIVAAWLLGVRWGHPVDGGATLPDGRPLLGSSKTWRGVAAALLAAALLSMALGPGLPFGLVFGALVVSGDLASSFVKRRRGLAPSEESPGWDQLLESLVPACFAALALGHPWWWSLPPTLAFIVIGICQTRLAKPVEERDRGL